ncbi:hypothetical protein [Nocardiopsis sp. HUAS JQ3]|uniref:hypothetical protein n=1 Tax=Nocardiopsis sp. HUAS JQ3 TaxID=3061629 RepID=UPI0023A9FD7E|nr:hypothetical protein [Nocardiopsis sp. HUAS JQ3]WDZ93566.1 hypothetical protein PV789_13925 [Nocardiopsis sp. HUAS JQ3]
MNGMSKLDAMTFLRNHGLLRMPVQIHRRPRRVTARMIRSGVGTGEALVVRTSSETEERNLPRLVGADAEAAAVWINELPPSLSALVQPYDQVLFSVELAVYDGLEAAEIISGIWELDNQLTPIVVGAQGDRVGLKALNVGTAQTARFHDLARGHYESPAQVDDWQVATVVEWIRGRRRDLAALRRDLGHSFGLKLHYSTRFGLSPQNLRSTVPLREAWTGNQSSPATAVAVLASTNEPIPSGPLLLDVSLAREQHAQLTRFLDRLREAGTREVYLRSGLLSHLAINLREAGITVRSAHG